jgi:hypothetical protein
LMILRGRLALAIAGEGKRETEIQRSNPCSFLNLHLLWRNEWTNGQTGLPGNHS